jgi:hypothetical protein
MSLRVAPCPTCVLGMRASGGQPWRSLHVGKSGGHCPDTEKRKQEPYHATTPGVGYRHQRESRTVRGSDRGCQTRLGWFSHKGIALLHTIRQPPGCRTGHRAPHAPSGAVVNRPVGYNSTGAAVSLNTGRCRAACGTMSVRAVRRLTGSTRIAARHRRVRDAGLNPRSSVWPSRFVS